MNRKQMIVLVLGAALVLLLALFPPWFHHRIGTQVTIGAGVVTPERSFDGFYLFSSDQPVRPQHQGMLVPKPDPLTGLSLQLGAIALTTVLVVILRSRKA